MVLKSKKYRKVTLTAVLLFFLAMIIVGTFAWFIGRDLEENHFSSPQLVFDVQAVDLFSPPGSVAPGDSVSKSVGAINNNTMPAFVRLLVAVSVVSSDGQPLEALPGKQLVFENLNSSDWTYGGDGYYYYLRCLGPMGSGTDQSPYLFTGVKLSEGLGEEYKNAKLDIVVKIEAVDTVGCNYRASWWDSEAVPQSQALLAIDTALQSAQNK